MLAMMMIVILCLCGYALDIAQLSNRKTALQGLATAIAKSAARELNGSASGVNLALARAASIASAWRYSYGAQTVTWNNAAIKFSDRANSNWIDAGAAVSSPNGLMYAKVDTGELDAAYGSVSMAFMQLLSGSDTQTVHASAIAGRQSINVLPLAICALSPLPTAPRTNPGPPPYTELVEFGFRRGVSYDLMQLNPAGTSPANFAIDPITPPGKAGSSANMTPAMLAPFVCGGTLAMPRITGGTITASQPFPLSSLYNELNSRFDQYGGSTCTPDGAPPDSNIKAYTYTSIPWMSTVPGSQRAQTASDPSKLWTIADPLPAPGTNTAAMYGPLWVAAKPVQYAASEPPGGYTSFATSVWASLYKPGVPTANSSYPGGSTPYKATSGTNFLAPSAAHQPGTANRRVLNIPLLSCPVAGGGTVAATVIGIGKFFMTVPATATSLFAEFGGAAEEQALGGQVVLVQ
jgi:hypothetical protein